MNSARLRLPVPALGTSAIRVIAAALTLIVAALILGRTALGQVPPHFPGTICLTDRFWCYAQPPGGVGTPCACPTPAGWVWGRRG